VQEQEEPLARASLDETPGGEDAVKDLLYRYAKKELFDPGDSGRLDRDALLGDRIRRCRVKVDLIASPCALTTPRSRRQPR
jgi:hypothetical protein